MININRRLKLSFYILISTFSYINAFTSYYLLVNNEGKIILLLSNIADRKIADLTRQHANKFNNMLANLTASGQVLKPVRCIFGLEPEILHILKTTGNFPKDFLTDPVTENFAYLASKEPAQGDSLLFQANDPRGQEVRTVNGLLSAIAYFTENNDYQNEDNWNLFKSMLIRIDDTIIVKNCILKEYFEALENYRAFVESYRKNWQEDQPAYQVLNNVYNAYPAYIAKVKDYFKNQNPNNSLGSSVIKMIEQYFTSKKFNTEMDLMFTNLGQNANGMVFCSSILDNVLKSQLIEPATLVYIDQWGKEEILKMLDCVGYKTIIKQEIESDSHRITRNYKVPIDFLENLLKITQKCITMQNLIPEINSENTINFFKDNITTRRCNSCNKLVERQQIKRCATCKKTYYCDKACQIRDWPKHKLNCRTTGK